MVDLSGVKPSQGTLFMSTPKTPFEGEQPMMLGTTYPSKQRLPVCQSPPKVSSSRSLSTPVSNSSSRPSFTLPSPSALRSPATFDASLQRTSSRYSAQHYTPFSPNRLGEYRRSGGPARRRTEVEKWFFGEDSDEGEGKGRNMGSSPLALAFEAEMVPRKGAPVDLVPWLRKNFHHIPSATNNASNPPPSTSLLAIRTLLLERFPRVAELDELANAVSAAFPHGLWDYPSAGSSDPPMIRGLVWHGEKLWEGKDKSDDDPRPITTTATPVSEPPQIVTRSTARASDRAEGVAQTGAGGDGVAAASRSPTQSTLVSPISSSARKLLSDTLARSVLEEFAEIATLTEKPPVFKVHSLPVEVMAPAPANALANICNSLEAASASSSNMDRKRRASHSPNLGRRRASTPDKLHGLLAAAEAVEGSMATHLLGHKRRKTIGGAGCMRDGMGGEFSLNKRHGFRGGTNVSPAIGARLIVPNVAEDDSLSDIDGTAAMDVDDNVNCASSAEGEVRESSALRKSLSTVSTALASGPSRGTGTASGTYSAVAPSTAVRVDNATLVAFLSAATSGARTSPRQRKANELPTEGDNPGVDCKPPYPYHELIRYAIEDASDQRLQLSQIYSSIAERFPFFKTLDEKKASGWQNSIRHNLSLKKMFVRLNKVDGIPDEGGKGGWWTVQHGVPDKGRPGRRAKEKRRAERSNGGQGGPELEGMSAAGSAEDRGSRRGLSQSWSEVERAEWSRDWSAPR